MKLGVILGTFLLGLALVLTTTPANALYNINVKVTNKTGKQITVHSVWWRPKGQQLPIPCWGTETIEAGKSYKSQCSGNASVQKWRRLFQVKFKCTGTGGGSYITISFPRSGKFYARNHAAKNSDTYSMNIKKSDC